MLRILITVPVVYWLFHYFNVCADCSETVSYVWIGIVSLFFYSMVFMLLDIFKFAFRSEENMQAVVFGAGIIFFGSMFLAHSCSGNKKHIASTAVPDTNTCTYYIVNADRLNVRAYASTTARRVARLLRNAKVCVTQKKGKWAYVKGKGWVYMRYLSPSSAAVKGTPSTTVVSKEMTKNSTHKVHPQSVHKHVSRQKKSVRKHKPVVIWHCMARSKRASGWVEKIGLAAAKKGALHQCEIRRQTEVPCRIVTCYKK